MKKSSSNKQTKVELPRYFKLSVFLLVIVIIETFVLYNVAPLAVTKLVQAPLTSESLNLAVLVVGIPIVSAGIAAVIAVLFNRVNYFAPTLRLTLLAMMCAPSLIIPYLAVTLLTYTGSLPASAAGATGEALISVASWLIWAAYITGSLGMLIFVTVGLIRSARLAKA